LPDASHIIIYIGALWGDWFDWELLDRLAVALPHYAFVLIGDYHGECERPRSNIHFLGLKDRDTLPAYLAYSDVAIIPWKVNEITHSTSPIKLFEYIAMGLPVVSTDFKGLPDSTLIFRAVSSQTFIELVEEAIHFQAEEDQIMAFIEKYSWKTMLGNLQSQLDLI
jgi:glycosyltransferase involved in cell wall biosynthesis